MLSTLQGVEAVEAVLDATPETPSPIISIIENKITRKPLMEAVRLTHSVAEAITAKDFAKAMSLRDAEFAEYFRCYMTTTATDAPEMLLPKEKVRSLAGKYDMLILRSGCELRLSMLGPQPVE